MADMLLRNVPDEAAHRLRRAAAARRMTQGEYIAALVLLHDALRARADEGDDVLYAELEVLGLQTVVA